MLEKISVRKPFTVLVGVILVIVLGVVSFMSTSTDLLPSMNLPYAVVMTTYIGATPEQVETEVTAPIENRMGTVGGIKNITSISNEHFSIVIMEFTDTTNMDSASLEIRESLDMAELPDGAGKPSILKLNPDMMPIMVTSVYMNGMSINELSALTKEKIAPAFEGIPGVASVSPSGLIKNQIYVVISEEKIEQANQKLRDAAREIAEKAMAEGQALVEEAIAAQVADYAGNRTAELMAQGLSAEQAGAQGQMELPAVTEQIAQAVTQSMTEAAGTPGGESLMPDLDTLGIPSEMLSISMVKNILTAQSFSMPAGMIESGSEEFTVRVGDKFTGEEDVYALLIFDPAAFGLEGLEAVRLSDVADVFATDNSDTDYTRVNGSPAVMLTMQKQTEFSTADLTSEIRAKMDELSDKYEGLEFAVLMDQGQYIDIIISSVINNLLAGGILALIILIIFLRDLRPTLVVGISIPISLLLAFTAMYFTGVSLNMLSMSGLALGVGMLVDNSIVVIENIYRLRNQGVPARRAAVEGAKEVSGAIVASTLTTIAVFLPVVFTHGITRQLFTDLGLTIAYSLLASLLIALTVVPAASSTVFHSMKEKEHRIFDRLRGGYAGLLRGALKIKWAVLLFSLAAMIASGIAIFAKGAEFIPSMDSEEIMVSVTMPEGAVFDDTVKIADILSARIQEIKDIKQVGATIAGSGGGMFGMLGGMFGGGGSGGMSISVYIILNEDRSMTNVEISELISRKSEDLDCEVTVSGGSTTDVSLLTGDAVSIKVTGRELDDLRDTAIQVAEIVCGVEGTQNVSDGSQNGAPELRIRVNKDEAMRRGLTTAQVFMAANGVVTNPETTVNMTLSGLDYEIVIQDASWNKPGRKAIEGLELTNNSGEKVKLTDIAEIYEDTGFTSIRRSDNTRFLTVSGEIAPGYNVTLVNNEIEKKLRDYTPAEGCSVTISGESEAINGAFNDLYLMLALALIFIYLIMVAQFQSLLSPFIVMFTIPLAFTGGFAGLLIAGMPLSVVGIVGLILLTGIVVNNGIVFVDCVNRLRKYEGMAKKDALVEAGRIRLRPILMTALTTIVAMSTMTIGMGHGTEMVQPMAVTVAAGLVYATFMTLFVIPCMYDLLHRNRDMTKDDDLDYERA